MTAHALTLRPSQSAAVRNYLASLADEYMADPEPLVRALSDPECVRFFGRIDDELEPVIDVEIRVTRTPDSWALLKTIPAKWLVLDRDVQAAIDAAVTGVEIPDDVAGLL